MTIELNTDTLTGWTVLIVDDEIDSLDVTTMLLQHYGATVIQAHNGQTALEKTRQEKPRFIISDLSMPGMSGWDMIEQLKQNNKTAHIPVIALTAHAMRDDRQKVLDAGFHNYLTKPLIPETFVHELLTMLLDIPEIAADLKITP